jgi:IMP dehydrogenase
MNFRESLSYDDVLLIPAFSEVLPGDVSVKTRLAGDLTLNIPILSAAMDTVTEDELAIALALEGGAGVIHRNLDAAEQARQVARVKRYLNWVIESPLTVSKDQTISAVNNLIKRHSISGLLVLDGEDKLCGIITARDLRFCNDESLKVKDVMTAEPIVERGIPTPESAQRKFDEYKIEKLPVVDGDNRVTGLITVKDMEKHQPASPYGGEGGFCGIRRCPRRYAERDGSDCRHKKPL